jgi:CPA2 family monovalent cation:H+ antiporter-2
MHAPAVLTDILAILVAGVVIALVFHRLRLPVLVGYVVAGIALGPFGLGLVRRGEDVAVLSEIGVVLLLFTIGIEFSLAKLLEARRSVLVAGPVQMFGTLAVGAAVALLLGRPPAEAALWGALLALSSTAIPLRILQQHAEMDSPHGRTALGIAIFQDLAVVPIMILLPILAGTGGSAVSTWVGPLLTGAAAVAGIVLLARYAIPRILLRVARTRDREVFLLSVIALGLAVAWAGASLGLSLAIGAFLAGLVLSESDYGHQALASLLPFRDVFLSIFFVSVGMSLDLRVATEHPLLVTGGALLVVLVKATIAGIAGIAIGLPIRAAVLTGLTLGNIGEFSLVVGREAASVGVLAETGAQIFLAVAVATMALTPLVMAVGPRLADALAVAVPRRPPGEDGRESSGDACPLLVIGFGLNGRNLALAAGRAGVGFAVIDMNPDSVGDARKLGCRVVYGDASQTPVLAESGAPRAQVAVVAVSDPTGTRAIVAALRAVAPGIHLIVRTRYATETRELLDLGADEVVPEEFETSVEIFSRVLRRFLVDEDRIVSLRAELRAGAYGVFRETAALGEPGGMRLPVPETEMRTLAVEEGSALEGSTLAEADLRRSCGVTVLAVRRGDAVEPNPDPTVPLRAGDSLVAFGTPESLGSLALKTRG